MPRGRNRQPMLSRDLRVCTRCGLTAESSGEWYGGLCPECADETEGTWICRVCGQRGNFEFMGGDGANEPTCCSSHCEYLPSE